MSWPSNFDWFIFRSVISINLRKIDVCCTKIFDVFPLVDMMLQLQSSAPYNLPNLCERGRKFHTQLNNNRCNRSCPCSSSCVYIRWLVERETLTPVTPDSGNNLTRQQRHLAVVNLQWRRVFFFPLKLSKLECCPNCFLGHTILSLYNRTT